MDVALKQKWVAALRSGEFKQFHGGLCSINEEQSSYCCLGVLAVVGNFREALDKGHYTQLNKAVDGVDTRRKLVTLNDDAEKTFPEIADWIEANIPASLPTAQGGGQ